MCVHTPTAELFFFLTLSCPRDTWVQFSFNMITHGERSIQIFFYKAAQYSVMSKSPALQNVLKCKSLLDAQIPRDCYAVYLLLLRMH